MKIIKLEQEIKNPDIKLSLEDLSGCYAKVSRSNNSFNDIYEEVKEKGSASVLKYLDYGHKSISDIPVYHLVFEDISEYLSFHIWNYAKKSGGIQKSTRYIDFSNTKFYCKEYTPEIQDFELKQIKKYNNAMAESNKNNCNLFLDYPEKKRKRLLKNLSLDSSRSHLPMSTLTVVAINITAMDLIDLTKYLLSAPYEEFNLLGNNLIEMIDVDCPNFVKHCYKVPEITQMFSEIENSKWSCTEKEYKVEVFDINNYLNNDEIRSYVLNKSNKYIPDHPLIKSIPVQWYIPSIEFAQLRDINRHRRGSMWFNTTLIQPLDEKNPWYCYSTFSHEFSCLRTSDLSQLLYEIELRTTEEADPKYKNIYINLAKELDKKTQLVSQHPRIKHLI